MLPKRCFVLGGASSGKSFWAEKLTQKYDKSKTYIATGQIFDNEMRNRVKIHQNRRDATWTTQELPLTLSDFLPKADPNHVLLIDCATMWLSNQMLAEHDLNTAQADRIDALRICPAPWIIVSNEVGHGIVPDNALARRFREAQGKLNCALAELSDLTVMVTAGLPHALKGTLP